MDWKKDLLKCLPEGRVLIDEASRKRASGDAWLAQAMPDVVVKVRETAEVAEVLRLASQHQVAVTPRGAGRGYVGGCVPIRGGIVLDVSRMNRILRISPEDGVAVVQPGVITQKLQQRVEKMGWFYPPDPASRDECTIGGNIATNAGGPRCLKYGVTKNYVLALEVVLADGNVLRVGTSTHKNKCGFDLVSLLVGSEGLLGIVTEATLRIIPLAAARAGLAISYATPEEAGAAVNAILAAGVLPCALEIADHFTLEAARSYAGKSCVPPGRALLIAEVDGSEKAVSEDLRRLRAALAGTGALRRMERHGEAVERELWGIRRQFSYALRATGLTKFNNDVVVPRSRIVDLLKLGERLHRKHGIAVACFGHAGDGNIHVNLMVDISREGAMRVVDAALDDLFRQVLKWGGTVTGEHGVGLARMPWWQLATPEVGRFLHNRIKTAFDPRGILNPGKFATSELVD